MWVLSFGYNMYYYFFLLLQKIAVDNSFLVSRRGIHVEAGAREKAVSIITMFLYLFSFNSCIFSLIGFNFSWGFLT